MNPPWTAAAALALMLPACTIGNGDLVVDTRSVAAFTTVDVDDGVAVDLDVDPSARGDVALTVSGPSNLLPLLVTDVRDGALFVDVNRPVTAMRPLHVEGTVARIDAVVADNGSALSVVGVDGDRLDVGADNGATVSVDGAAGTASIVANNGASVELGDLAATEVHVDVDNGASVTVCATGRVTGSVDNGAVLEVACGGDRSGVSVANGGVVR